MHKIITQIVLYLLFPLLLSFNTRAQSIFKGLKYGMSQTQANAEFKTHKKNYTNLDIGDDYIYRTYKQDFIFEDNKLVGIIFSPRGSAFGQSYKSSKNYLLQTKDYLERLGYVSLIQNTYWNDPLEFIKTGEEQGLVMHKNKSTIAQLLTTQNDTNYNSAFIIKLIFWNYNYIFDSLGIDEPE